MLRATPVRSPPQAVGIQPLPIRSKGCAPARHSATRHSATLGNKSARQLGLTARYQHRPESRRCHHGPAVSPSAQTSRQFSIAAWMHSIPSPITAAGILSPRPAGSRSMPGNASASIALGPCGRHAHRQLDAPGAYVRFVVPREASADTNSRPASPLSRRCSIILIEPPARGGIRSGWRFGAAGVSRHVARVNPVIVCQQDRSRRRLPSSPPYAQTSRKSQPGCNYSGGYLVKLEAFQPVQ